MAASITQRCCSGRQLDLLRTAAPGLACSSSSSSSISSSSSSSSRGGESSSFRHPVAYRPGYSPAGAPAPLCHLPRRWSAGNPGRATVVMCSASTTAVATPPSSEASAGVAEDYEAVIGIETHVQLRTRSKAFCSCANEFGAPANAHICPVCMGHPGTLPVLNQEAVLLGVRAGLALSSHIAPRSKFDRKQYFYPDLPKGYQISQYDEPLCSAGHLEVDVAGEGRKRFGITRAHLEEDAGKTNYSGSDGLAGSNSSLVDYNRAGVPLLEIVSEPDMRSGKEAAAYGAELRRIMMFLGISDGNMQDGSMRCDVNVSVRPKGVSWLGTKVEVKNMNSFSGMQRAIEFEVQRQVALMLAGKGDEVVQETRLWDEGKLVTFSMRKKEGLADYRYFPEPDLPSLTVTQELLDEVKATMPELPEQLRARYLSLGLPPADVLILTDEVATARLFDQLLVEGAAPAVAANWVRGDIVAYCKENKVALDQLEVTPGALAEMLRLIEDGTISGKIAKDMLPQLLQGAGNSGVRAFVESSGLLQISDVSAVEEMVDRVLAANPKQLEQYKAGKTKLAGFFTGQVMKESQGRVNPALMNQVLMKKLSESLQG